MDTTYREVCSCGICGRVVRKPKTLPCFHSFCERCLHQHVNGKPAETADAEEQRIGETAEAVIVTSTAGRVGDDDDDTEVIDSICPACEAPFNFPQGGVIAMATDLFLQRVAREMITSNSIVQMCGGVCASQSKETAAVSMCRECNGESKFLCVECSGYHAMLCPKHTVVPVQMEADVDPGDDEEDSPESTFCTDHPEERPKVFCSVCFQARCGECGKPPKLVGKNPVNEASRHTCEWVNIETGSKKLVDNLQSSLKQKSSVLKHHESSYSSVLEPLEVSRLSAIEAVEAEYQSIVDMALERKISLISQIRTAVQWHHTVVEQGKNETEENRKAVDHLLAYCSALSSRGTGLDIINSCSNLKRAVDKTSTGEVQAWKTKRSVWYSPVADDVKKKMTENMFGVVISGVTLNEFEGRRCTAEDEEVAYIPTTDTIMAFRGSGSHTYFLNGSMVCQCTLHEGKAHCVLSDRMYIYRGETHRWLSPVVLSTGHLSSSCRRPLASSIPVGATAVRMYALTSNISTQYYAVLLHQGASLEINTWSTGLVPTVFPVNTENRVVYLYITAADNNIFTVMENTADKLELVHLISADQMANYLADRVQMPTQLPNIWKLDFASSAPCTGLSALNERVFVMKGPAENTPCGLLSVVSYQGQFLQNVDFSRLEWSRALSVRKILGQKDGVYIALLD